MAIDKAIDSAQLDKEMLATANAIRTKGGTEEAIPWETDTGFEQAVLAIKGGADLNFEVVGGETVPVDPVENTIWVNTETEITSWIFSAEEPEAPEEGMVWFDVNPSASILFNALKENGITIHDSSVMQYIGGTWENADAMIYQNAEWIEMGITYLYNHGDQCNAITGGWNAALNAGSANATPTFTFGSNDATINNPSGVRSGIISTKAKIDLTGVRTLYLNVTSRTDNGYNRFYIGPTFNTSDGMVASYDSIQVGVNALDVSSMSGSYYVGIYHYSNGAASITFNEVYMK